MAIMTDIQSVAANTTIANCLSGKSAEFVKEASVVTLYALASAVGMRYTMIVGDEIVVEDQEVGVGTTLPKVPDDVIAQAGGFPGDRIVVKLHNTTGGAVSAYTRVDVEPA